MKIRKTVSYLSGPISSNMSGYAWEPWSACEDEAQKKRITEYCIMF